MRYSHISVAIPMLAEYDNLPALLESLKRQTLSSFSVYCCVNNPEGWADSGDDTQRAMYADNRSSLDYLYSHASIASNVSFHIIDRSSPGNGWSGKQRGVGHARKVLFDTISAECGDNEIVVSLDADTGIGERYLESVLTAMNSHPEHSAMAVPYYHPLIGDEKTDRALLRYEIYMRHYLINLLESNNPYAFTALGSAMVFPLWAYRRVGGITPLQGGEDFYLMQKFAKTGHLLNYCDEMVEPQGRPSLRVPFGTGPAIAKGVETMDESYPLYPHEGFQMVADTYALFPRLYDEETETPMSGFMRQQLKTDDLWQPLRKNFKTRELFVHACTERVDGLRILQYLKTLPRRCAEDELRYLCNSHGINIPTNFNFLLSSISEINDIRNALFDLESHLRIETNSRKF